ncbi:MAG: FtsX-like permease family protein [Bacteroidota bacterium]
MNSWNLIWIELWLRKSRLISGLLAITLGIAVMVGIKTLTQFSEKAVAVKLDNLGANILVLPQGASIADYYAADIDGPTLPQEYVERVMNSTLEGVDNLSPKLSRSIEINGIKTVLTGILPKSEIASKPLWQSVGLVSDGVKASCASNNEANTSHGYEDPKLQHKGIDTLQQAECLLGAAIASKIKLKAGARLMIKTQEFTVARVLPETGTIDDDRIFIHLKKAQEVLGIPDQISAIEIMGCCNAISDGLLSKLRNVLPDTRVTTIGQIVSTQVETNKLMKKISLLFLMIILFVGGISIGNFMWANVNERTKEIGVLRMLGFPAIKIFMMFMTKALILGFMGGILGYLIGTLAAVYLGPQIAGIAVSPVFGLFAYAILLSVFTALLGSLFPVILTSKIDPYLNLQEV